MKFVIIYIGGDKMKAKYRNFLKEYKHSIPIIYAHIERQYKYDVLFDEEEEYGILLTQFDYHYAFGKAPQNITKFIDYLREYISSKNIEEFIIYGPNKKWNTFLNEVFHKINGKTDKRLIYKLNRSKFNEYDTKNSYVKLELIDDHHSSKVYPQGSVYINDKLISFCRAFMIGKNEAELDVWTDEKFRLKGFAFDGSLCLLEYLLNEGIEPNWSCWEKKESSHILAKKLGFELSETITTYVWVKEFGSF